MRIRQRGSWLHLVRPGEGADAKAEMLGAVKGPDFKADDELAGKLTDDEKKELGAYVDNMSSLKSLELKYAAAKFPETLKLVVEWLAAASAEEAKEFGDETRVPLTKLRRELAKTAAPQD